LVQVKLSLLI